jgi:CRP-like cAMP-binding protein
VREGEFAFDLYAIKKGSAEVQQRGERLAALGPGDVFGELGVTRPETGRWSRRRTASVVVSEPTDVIAIDGGAVRNLIGEIPTLRAALSKAAETHGRGE